MRAPRLLLALAVVAPAAGFAAEPRPLPSDLPPFGPDKPLPVPAVEAWTTPEGLTVWLLPRRSLPRTSIVLAARGGLASDPKGKEGMAELFADTLGDGTPTRAARRIAEDLQAVGAGIGVEASKDAVLVKVRGLSRGTEKMLEVLADVVRNASFPDEEVRLAKANALTELQARMSTAGFLASKAFARAIYGSHPYRVVAPTPEVIASVTPELLRQELTRRLRPERTLLVVVGDVDVAATRRTINTLFGGWKVRGRGAPPVPVPPRAPSAPRILVVDRPGSVQSQIMVGRPAPRAIDPESHAGQVTSTLLGGSFGSRLMRNIREDKGYSYAPGAGVNLFQQGGLLRVWADVRNEVTGATLNEILYELGRLGTTRPTDEEVRTAKRFESGNYVMDNQLQAEVASRLATNWVNGLPPDELGTFVSKINAVTAAEVQKLGRSLFLARTQTIVVVGDASKIMDELRPFGAVQKLDGI